MKENQLEDIENKLNYIIKILEIEGTPRINNKMKNISIPGFRLRTLVIFLGIIILLGLGIYIFFIK